MARALVLLLLASALGTRLPAEQGPGPMPLPWRLAPAPGVFRLDPGFRVAVSGYTDDRLERAVERLLGRLERRLGVSLDHALLPTGTGPAALEIVVVGPGEAVQTPAENESYTLTVAPEGARLSAPTVTGALRGLETLLQLVVADPGGFAIPGARIEDRPRFRWRGLLLDSGRHFLPLDVIRRTLDGMAVVKLNVLHWHLSDDQGFRVESRRFPRLHQLGSDGLYYTREEIRGIVAYARDRGIRVVPEFDMPGHATSWFVGYPELASGRGPYAIERRFGVFDPAFDPTRETVWRFLEEFVEEMAPLFPDPWWHIGGDEVTGREWRRNPAIARFMRRRGMPDTRALQGYFTRRLTAILARHGKRVVGWDEILGDSLPAGTTVQSWRRAGYLSRATARGHPTLLSAPWYLDHMKPADEYYAADPLPGGSTPAAADTLVLGGEACMWGEQIDGETLDSRLWPRLAAIAERLWSPAEVRDVDDMYRRLSLVSAELERIGLGHETHTDRMLGLHGDRREVQPLHDLLAVTMPVTFGQRVRLQAPTQQTPLDRLVDAARPDPWARSRLNRLAARAVGGRDSAASRVAREELRHVFQGWVPLAAAVEALGDSMPLAGEGVPAGQALAELGRLGLEALERLDRGRAPPGWRLAARRRLEELDRPHGLLRLAVIEVVGRLVESGP